VVLTTWIGGPRLVWSTFDDHRWLYVPTTDVAAGRLRAAGVNRFLFVTIDLDAELSKLADFTVVSRDGPANGDGYQVLVLDSGLAA